MQSRSAYLSDVSDEKWTLDALYLTLLREDAGQREHALRQAFNGSALRGALRRVLARHASQPRPKALILDLSKDFSTLECERLPRCRFHSEAQTQMVAFNYFKALYNPPRWNSALGYR